MAYSYEALFEDLTGATGYSALNVQLAADITRETVTELQVLAQGSDSKDQRFESRRTVYDDFQLCENHHCKRVSQTTAP